MEEKDIIGLIKTPTDLITKVKKFQVVPDDDVEHLQYEPENHAVMDASKRPKKMVSKPTGLLDANNNPIMREVPEEVTRITFAAQKLIVDEAVDFLTGVPIELEAEPKDDLQQNLLDMLIKTDEDNKVNYKNSMIAETFMVEKECVELWTMEDAEPDFWGELGFNSGGVKSTKKMRVTILKRSDGYTFYPVKNIYGKLTAFGIGYKIKIEDKEYEYFDIHTANFIYHYISADNGWAERKTTSINSNGQEIKTPWPLEQPIGKMGIIYHYQKKTEWADAQPANDRLETSYSNHGDTNDYNGSPILGAFGKIKGFAAKGERGKVFEMEAGADLKYITWDRAPESVKMENENLIDIIHTTTRTPYISSKDLKGLGNMPIIGIKLLFRAAHAKAKKKQNSFFGDAIQRRYNFLKAAMGVINQNVKGAVNMPVTPKFGLYMPSNEKEEVEIENLKVQGLMQANGNQPVIGHEESLEFSPYKVEDQAKNWKSIQEKQAQEQVTLEI